MPAILKMEMLHQKKRKENVLGKHAIPYNGILLNN
jgi:hypothetical protein